MANTAGEQKNKRTEKQVEKRAVQKKKTSKKTGKFTFIKKGFNYFIESKEELKKVTWPSRKEAIKYTITVIIISLVAAAFLGLADYFLTEGLNLLLKK